jgi:hypothetical protein
MTLAALGEELAKARAWVVVSAVTEQEVSTAADFSADREDSAASSARSWSSAGSTGSRPRGGTPSTETRKPFYSPTND